MKSVISAIYAVNGDMYRTADTVNHEGGKAWNLTENQKVMQIAMTGTFGNSFYASTKDLVESAIDTFKQADVQTLHDAIIKGRNEGFIRTGNILGLIYLSLKSMPHFRDAFNEVIKTGNDMDDFISMTKKIRGFGRGIQKAMHSWIEKNASEYYALKYRTQIADAIRISRFKGEDPIYKFILGHYGDRVKGWDENSLNEAYKKYPKLQAYKDASEYIAKGESSKAKSLIEEHHLDVASLFGIGSVEDSVWKSFAKVMPTMMLLKYLNKLDSTGVTSTKEGIESIKNALTVDRLKKARVFPFRLYIAYMNVTNMTVKNILAGVLDEYVNAYDWETFDEAGSWAICPDISGSMCAKVSGSDQTPAVIAGLFSGFFYKGLNDSIVIPWGSTVKDYSYPKFDSVISHIDRIAKANGGGTNMEVALDHMIQNQIKKDNVLYITDAEEYGNGWLNSWKKYKRYNPKAKAFLIRVDGYNTSPISEELAKEFDVYQLFGWSDNSVKYIEYILEASKKSVK